MVLAPVPQTPSVTELSVQELVLELTTLQDRRTAGAAARRYEPRPGGVAHHASHCRREGAIVRELRRRHAQWRGTITGTPGTAINEVAIDS